MPALSHGALIAAALGAATAAGCGRGGGGASASDPRSEVVVRVDGPGRSAAQLEDHAAGIERALAGVPGVRATRSIAAEGTGRVAARFDSAARAEAARAQVASAVNAAELPDGVTASLAPRAGVDELAYALTSPTLSAAELTALADRMIEPRLAAVAGVSAVSRCGGAERELAIELDGARLAAVGLDVAAVLHALASDATSLPAGRLEPAGGVSLRVVDGRAGELDTLGERVLGERGGAAIRLRDVATLTDGAVAPACDAFRGNGRAVLGFVTLADPRARTVVGARLEELSRELPPGTALERLWPRGTRRLAVRTATLELDERIGLAERLIRGLADAGLEGTALVGAIDGAPPDDRLVVVLARDADERSARAALEAAVRALPGLGPVRGGPETRVRVIGPDLAELERLASALRTQLAATPGVDAVDQDGGGTRPQLELTLDRDKLAALGVSASAAQAAIAALTAGVSAGELVDRDRTVPIRVHLRGDLIERGRVPLATATGAAVTLADVTTLRTDTTPASIAHLDGQRVTTVWLRGPGATAAARQAVAALALPPGYRTAIDQGQSPP